MKRAMHGSIMIMQCISGSGSNCDAKDEVKMIDEVITTRPKEHIRKPLVCIKSVSVLPSTGESSSEPKSATWQKLKLQK